MTDQAKKKLEELREIDNKAKADRIRDSRALPLTEEFEFWKEHMSVAGSDDVSDEEAKARQFLMWLAARVDDASMNGGKVLSERVRSAKILQDLEWCERLRNSKMAEISEDLRTNYDGSAVRYLCAATEKIEELAKDLEKQSSGNSIEIPEEALVEGNIVRREAIEEILAAEAKRGRKVSAFIERETSTVLEQCGISTAARQTVAAIRQGLPGSDYDNPEADKQVASSSELIAMALALTTQKRAEENALFIPNAPDNVLVAAPSWQLHMDDCAANGFAIEDIRKEYWFNSDFYRNAMAHMQRPVREWLVLATMVDTMIFPSQLFLTFVQQPVPRVIEFSRAFLFTSALSNCLDQVLKARTAADLQREYETIVKLFSGGSATHANKNLDFTDLTQVNEPAMDVLNTLLLETQQRIEDEFQANVDRIRAWYAEKRDAKQYYRALYTCILFYRRDRLRNIETRILRRLWRYFPANAHERFLTRAREPDAGYNHVLTATLLRESNRKLLKDRLNLREAMLKAGIVVAPATIGVEKMTAFGEEHVMPDQPWTPTFAEMAEFDSHLNSLAVLTEAQNAEFIAGYMRSLKLSQ